MILDTKCCICWKFCHFMKRSTHRQRFVSSFEKISRSWKFRNSTWKFSSLSSKPTFLSFFPLCLHSDCYIHVPFSQLKTSPFQHLFPLSFPSHPPSPFWTPKGFELMYINVCCIPARDLQKGGQQKKVRKKRTVSIVTLSSGLPLWGLCDWEALQ